MHKKRLCVLLMVIEMLFTPFVINSHALLSNIIPLYGPCAEASSLPELYSDAAIPISDQNFEAEIRNIIGKPVGAIVVSDVAGIAYLNVSGHNIADLSGIEYFTSLETLHCKANQLTELDVRQNTMLKEIICDQNLLTTLDVSHNTELTMLECRMNQLTTLDVSHNTALEVLYTRGNRLTSLNVSGATVLERLDCSNNDLASLDVSQNTALTSLSCGDNQLTMLDVRNNTALKKLQCSDNRLATLDVSRNTTLSTFYCADNRLTTLDVKYNTALSSFYCNSNRLTTLDVRNNAVLTTLNCNGNRLTTLDVRSNTLLTTLECQLNLFFDKSAILGLDENRLVSFLFDPQGDIHYLSSEASPPSGLPNDEAIQIPDLNFEAEVRSIIGKPEGAIMISDVAGVTYLNVSGLDIADLTGIEYFTALETLNCKRNQLVDLNIRQNTLLTVLHCEWNQLTMLDVSHNTALGAFYCHNNQLKTLDISQNTELSMLDVHNNLFPDKSAIIGLDERQLDLFVFNQFNW